MTERGGEIEMDNGGITNNNDDPCEKKEFERSLRKTLEEGDADAITKKITLKALTNCDTNALLMAMEVSCGLHRLAAKKGPEEGVFTTLANSVDEFTSCLLDPLKSNTEDRQNFGHCLDCLFDTGINLEQKKFFAHPVMYNLMRIKWFGTFGEMKRSSWLEIGRWTWIFLNIWCLFDIVLFPFLFTLFYIKHRINKVTHRSKELQGKNIFDSYREYFTTPYFVFIRDTLSYLALLGLHFALCLETSSISFSGLEWVILVFFLGRILMESRQFLDVKAEKNTATTNFEGSKYQSCNGTEKVNTSIPSKRSTFLHKCNKYLSDRWNILDFITLLNYSVIFVFRVVTWPLTESVTNNRALVISGYLYGLNTMFLTLRAFGQVMETVKGIGTIQIALFNIIGDIVAIFWQFAATILAFSIAITKVYIAERSFISKNSDTESACKTSSGLACWWSIVEHLTWSLLGIAELDPLDSVDGASMIVVYFLFGAFLVMGVILLVNMMIALLSNTYQRIQDNSLKEWSFKKAITIQTYSTYHPIPVPLNLISHLFLWIKWLCLKCARGSNWQPKDKPGSDRDQKKLLDGVVRDLANYYFASHGYSFPLTDERKMDHVLHETEGNRKMANQIAYSTFAAHGVNESIFPMGPKAWKSQGIRIQGCLLTCEGSAFCSECTDSKSAYHGARYKFPFSPDSNHFEVLIQEEGERRFLAVGVVGKDYSNHEFPGWWEKTVGYHIDEGRVYDAENAKEGRECEDAMAYRGDLIGCTVKFDKAEEGKVSIVFSLNGRQITQNEISMDYSRNGKFLYPYIAMGYVGIRVLAKLSSHQDMDKGLTKVTETEIEDADPLAREDPESILKTLEEIERKCDSSFLGIRLLCKTDTDKQHNVEILTKIKKKIDQIKRMMEEQFKAVGTALEKTSEISLRHANEQKELRENVQERFHHHQDFI